MFREVKADILFFILFCMVILSEGETLDYKVITIRPSFWL